MSVSTFLPLVPAPLRERVQFMPQSYLAIGAVLEQKPVGLVLVNLRDDGAAADLLSLTVAEGERRKGIGRKLLGAVQKLLREGGRRRLMIEFVADGDKPTEANAFFAACGVKVESGIHIFSGPTRGIFELAWVDSFRLPSVFAIEPWASVSEEERKELKKGQGIWYPPHLSPFLEEAKIDLEWSVALRCKGGVVGWLIMEVFDEDTVLMKTMFVQEKYQRLGRGIALMAEIGRRVRETPRYRNGIFFVEADNGPMVRFMYERIDHSTVRKEILWRGQLEMM